nr:hypothetical protein Q903MT_gene6428 [Picea sitchensis]
MIGNGQVVVVFSVGEASQPPIGQWLLASYFISFLREEKERSSFPAAGKEKIKCLLTFFKDRSYRGARSGYL